MNHLQVIALILGKDRDNILKKYDPSKNKMFV